jgi:hypothetical protein
MRGRFRVPLDPLGFCDKKKAPPVLSFGAILSAVVANVRVVNVPAEKPISNLVLTFATWKV